MGVDSGDSEGIRLQDKEMGASISRLWNGVGGGAELNRVVGGDGDTGEEVADSCAWGMSAKMGVIIF